MSQLRSDMWCSAFLRRHNNLGNICVVSRRGDPIAGQIWIAVDHLDGTHSLLGPAPALVAGDSDRLFQVRVDGKDSASVQDRVARETGFDPDFWLISLETREIELGVDVYQTPPKHQAL